MKRSYLVAALVLLVACGTAAADQSAVIVASTPSSVASPSPATVEGPSPRPPVLGKPSAAQPLALPAALPVTFIGLRSGTYPVHLHRICSGAQGFHLAYLQGLVVGAGFAGTIYVPRADFGRGWCVIVYARSTLAIVVAVRRI